MMEIKTAQQFIELIAPAVIENCKRHGWGVPSAIIAQATLESMKSSGWSGLASTCYNFWGMKWKEGCGCEYKEYKTSEQKKDGTYYTVIAKFRKYPTIEGLGGGIDGYFKFIESYSRYNKVKTAKTYTEYATFIREAGWATSLSYTQNIINTVLKYGLAKYDNGNVAAASTTTSDFVIGKTYTTAIDLNIRDNPNGNKVKYECITEDGKAHANFDTYGSAVLLKGTRVTCKDVKSTGYATWIRIPSGWICGRSGTNNYIL